LSPLYGSEIQFSRGIFLEKIKNDWESNLIGSSLKE
jgi:hypothetical protein